MRSISLPIKVLLLAVCCPVASFASDAPAKVPVVSDEWILYLLLGVVFILLMLLYFTTQIIRKVAQAAAALKQEGKNLFSLFLIGGFTLVSNGSYAQAADPVSAQQYHMGTDVFWMLVCIIAFLTWMLLFYFRALSNTLTGILGEEKPVLKPIQERKSDWWKKLVAKLTKSVPVEEEASVLTDHEYDGIRELDNKLPPWWVWMFYLSIFFGFIYIIHYHIAKSGNLQLDEYKEELVKAEEQKKAYLAKQAAYVDENNVEVVVDKNRIKAGKQVFDELCKACHGAEGQGGVGPNLTDKFWLHGGGVKNIFKTVKYGVPQKGMISWRAQLKPKEMANVASYIVGLAGTNPPNPKDPQGEIWVDSAQTVNTDSSVAAIPKK